LGLKLAKTTTINWNSRLPRLCNQNVDRSNVAWK